MMNYTMLPVQIHIYDSAFKVLPEPDTLCLVYVLSGHVVIEENIQLHTQDVMTLTSHSPDATIVPFPKTDTCYALIYLCRVYISSRCDFSDNQISINTTHASTNDDLRLQNALQQLIQAYFPDSEPSWKDFMLILDRFIDILLDYNLMPDESKISDQQIKSANKLRYLLDFGYQQEKSLSFLSDELHLSPQYISSISKQILGESYTHYLTNLRLDCAVNHLLYTDMNVTQITAICGFSNVKALNQAFQKRFLCSPTQYKKSHAGKPKIPLLFSDNKNYPAFHKLYLRYPQIQSDDRHDIPSDNLKIDIRLSDATPFVGPKAEFVYLGGAPNLLSNTCLQKLRYLRDTCNIRYVRVNSLFQDQYLQMSESYHKSIQALQNLLSIGLLPMVSFMVYPGNDSAGAFINFFNYCCSYFGSSDVKNWYFECCCPKPLLYASSQTEIDDIAGQIISLVRAVKQITPAASIGVNFFSSIDPSENAEYLCRCLQNGHVTPDFVTANVYTMHIKAKTPVYSEFLNPENLPPVPERLEKEYRLSGNSNYCYQKLKSLRQTLRTIFRDTSVPIFANIHIDLHAGNLLNDSVYASTFLLMNILKTYTFTDNYILPILADNYHFSYTDNHQLMQGIYSLYTCNDIPKPMVFAFQFLNELGNLRLSAGDTFMATADSNRNITCLLLNYKHPRLFYCNHPQAVSPEDVAAIFRSYPPEEAELTIHLDEPAVYLAEELSINQEHGSILDLWLKSNQLQQPNYQIVRHLKELIQPSYRFYKLNASKTLKIRTTLETHEIKLIKLYRYDVRQSNP